MNDINLNKILLSLLVFFGFFGLFVITEKGIYYSFRIIDTNKLQKAQVIQSSIERENVMDYGAKGDGKTDDTAVIQSVIDKVFSKGGGTVYIPEGIFMINTLTGIVLKNGVNIEMTNLTTLQAIANSESVYRIISIRDVSNVNISGGNVKGDRANHIGTTGEWGMCIWLISAKNVTIDGTNISDCWGDGIYVSDNTVVVDPSMNIVIKNVYISNVRRNGIAGISWVGGQILNSTIKNSNGTSPQSGIDFEPNDATKWSVSDITVKGNTISDNRGNGIQICCKEPGVSNNLFENNTITNNGSAGNDGIAIYGSISNTFRNNTISQNGRFGIYLIGSNNIFSANTISSNNQLNQTKKSNVIVVSGSNNKFDSNIIKSGGGSVIPYAGVYISSHTAIGSVFTGNFYEGPWQTGGLDFWDNGEGTIRNDQNGVPNNNPTNPSQDQSLNQSQNNTLVKNQNNNQNLLIAQTPTPSQTPKAEPTNSPILDDIKKIIPEVQKTNQVKSNMRLGSKGDEVKNLQKFLIENNYLDKSNNTGIYDSKTKDAVGALQLEWGILKDYKSPGFGQTGPKTRNIINTIIGGKYPAIPAYNGGANNSGIVSSSQNTSQISKTLYYGSRGVQVSSLQNILYKQGLIEKKYITGFYGKITENAVKKFQTVNNIVKTGTPKTTGFGVVGPKTRKQVNSLVN